MYIRKKLGLSFGKGAQVKIIDRKFRQDKSNEKDIIRRFL